MMSPASPQAYGQGNHRCVGVKEDHGTLMNDHSRIGTLKAGVRVVYQSQSKRATAPWGGLARRRRHRLVRCLLGPSRHLPHGNTMSVVDPKRTWRRGDLESRSDILRACRPLFSVWLT
jgi:hypothetical protein